MTEIRAHRLKRLRMRSWRRGMREMDLIFGRYADDMLHDLTDEELDAYEGLLHENDNDLFLWVAGRADAPKHCQAALLRVSEHLRGLP